MEDNVADAAALEGTRRLQVFKLEEYSAVNHEMLEEDKEEGKIMGYTSLQL